MLIVKMVILVLQQNIMQFDIKNYNLKYIAKFLISLFNVNILLLLLVQIMFYTSLVDLIAMVIIIY